MNHQSVLFVDDEQNVLNSLRRLLHDEPWNMFSADSGEKGLAILEKEKIDLVISDVRMPVMDGIQFLKQVKQRYPHVVRIFLSGYADHKAVVQALAEGSAQQLLPKPWKDEELREVIRGALKQAEELQKKNERLQRIINSLSSLPTMPHTYLKVKKCLADIDNVSIDQISDLIEEDTSISAELLRWANSALFGQRHQVDTVKRAVLVLGLDIVDGLVLSESVFSSVAPGSSDGFDLKAFQTHSLACGIAAKLLISELPYMEPKDEDWAFTAGLLHDIGKLIEARYLTEQYKKIIITAREKKTTLLKAEHEVLGTTHEEIGSYLADWWSLPSFIVNAVRWHHEPALCNANREIIAAVHVADVLVQHFALGSSGNYSLPEGDPEIWARFDLTEETLSSIKESLIKSLA
ncbi:MAG: HDOD domain-containing protein [Nitrospiraceae bacterium]|nr:MAG: HDOD domain-containing protein [Nitrospiraceae bacterium]